MDLSRVTDRGNRYVKEGAFAGQSCTQFTTSKSDLVGEFDLPIVVAEFPDYGGGEKNQSDFEVVMRWPDIEQAIEKFCELGVKDAIAVRDAIRLAMAAQNAGWRAVTSP